VALHKIAQAKPARAQRLPGESPIEWTVRTAYLGQKPTGRWVIFYTDIITAMDGSTTYRTAQQACFTLDRGEANERLHAWKAQKLTPIQAQSHTRGLSFPDLAESYLKDVSRDRFTRTQHVMLAPAIRFFEHDLAVSITEERLRDYHDHLIAKGYKQGTQRSKLSAVLTVLRHGVKVKLIPAGSAPSYRLPAFGAPRQFVLTPEQDALVFETAAKRFLQGGPTRPDRVDTRTALFVCIAADSAQRRDAILALTWERVDMTPGMETMDFRRPERQVANKKAAVVPVSDRLLPILKHARALAGANPTGKVFDSVRILRGIDTLREQVGIPGLTPHVFRHSWATFALKRGMPIALVARIMADTPETITRIYLHLVTDDTREAMRRYMAPSTMTPGGQTHVVI
jgi:integrase